MKAINSYNLAFLLKKRSDESSYHMPGGRTFRNQFVNLKAGETFGPFVSDDELVVTCYAGEFQLEPAGDEKLVVWALGAEGNKKEDKARLVQLDQAVVEARCPLTLICVEQGTVQIIGTPGRADSAKKNKK